MDLFDLVFDYLIIWYFDILLDQTIQKIRKGYLDPSSNSNINKVSQDLQEIQDIMKRNISDVLERGTKLDGFRIQFEDNWFWIDNFHHYSFNMTTKYQSIKQPLIFHLILAQHIFQMIVIYLIFCFLDVTDKSKKINQQTSQLKWGAKKLEMNVIWRQYAPLCYHRSCSSVSDRY